MTKEEQIKYIEENYPYVCGRCSTRRIRDSFFDNIKTEIQAYLLGFHCADGCVDNRRNTFRIQLQEADSEIVYMFKDFVAPDSRLFTFEPRTGFDKRSNKTYIKGKMFGIDIYCKKLNSGLEKWGFGQNKTYNELHLPNIDKSLIRHFIRGYFDGDGCISWFVRKLDKKHRFPNINAQVIFTSKTKTLFEEIINYLNDYNITHCSIFNYKQRNCYMLCISKSELPKLFHLLYDDSNFYLKRKYDKFNHFVNTEVTQLIAEYRNAQKVSASDSNNPPTSAEHPTRVKMCAELTGNCENSEIKSSEDNKLGMEWNDCSTSS